MFIHIPMCSVHCIMVHDFHDAPLLLGPKLQWPFVTKNANVVLGWRIGRNVNCSLNEFLMSSTFIAQSVCNIMISHGTL